jgi:hypothetical protein
VHKPKTRNVMEKELKTEMDVQLMLIRHGSGGEEDELNLPKVEGVSRKWSSLVFSDNKRSIDDLKESLPSSRKHQSFSKISSSLLTLNSASMSSRFSLRRMKKQPEPVPLTTQEIILDEGTMYPRLMSSSFEYDLASEIELEKERKAKLGPDGEQVW